MKKISLFILMGFLICSSFIFVNEGEKPVTPLNLATDYRDPYIGYFYCSRWATSFKSDGTPSVAKDTITIHITKDAIDSVLQFTIGSGVQKFKLVNTNLSAYPGGSFPFRSGGFYSTAKVQFMINQGRASSIKYIGVKN